MIFFLLKTVSKFLNIILARFIDKNLVKNVINGSNLVKIGHFWWKWSKLVHFGIIWGSKCRHMSKFLESSPIILSLQVSKNYFRFMDLNVVKNAINGGNLVKIGHIWWKWSKLCYFGIIWGQNAVICQTFGKVVR